MDRVLRETKIITGTKSKFTIFIATDYFETWALSLLGKGAFFGDNFSVIGVNGY
jgi:hypothetical protein